MSDPRPTVQAPSSVTARMYVNEHIKRSTSDAVKLAVAYAGGRNQEWAASTPTGSVDLTLGKANGASRFFEEAIEAGDDIEIVFRRVPRE